MNLRVLEVPFKDREIVNRKEAKLNKERKSWECSIEKKNCMTNIRRLR